jgi:pyruvate dehydrogenase E2 component (dihydrolipoamide acetyltransferase)
MEEGIVLRWLVAVGEPVKRGEPLVEVETDKANMVYEADVDGVLLRIITPEGESAAIGQPIALVGSPGEDVGADPRAVGAAPQEPSSAVAASAGPSPAPAPALATVATATATGAGGGGTRAVASPVARRIAAELGIDLATLVGSGPRGRIVKADVHAAAEGGGVAVEAPVVPVVPVIEPPAAPAPAAAPVAAPESGAKGDVQVVELSSVQRTIARRMSESRATVPDFELRVAVDMTGCVELRARLKELADAAPTYNDMIVKACALALREHPRVNGSYRDGRFELYSRVNVGVAVAAGDALIVPTVFDADRKSLGEIARTTRGLAAKVRDGKITPPELAGGTFSVSNLGMFGIDSFAAVVNSPQAAILAVGAMAPRAVVDDSGRVVARQTLDLTLASDHRILYGADAAQFLARVRELLEQPLALAF